MDGLQVVDKVLMRRGEIALSLDNALEQQRNTQLLPSFV